MKADAKKLIQRTANSIKEGLLGLIYPRSCYGCEAAILEQDVWLCHNCSEQLHPITHPLCDLCGHPYSGEMASGFQCPNCTDRLLQFDFARAGYQSRDLARALVHRFKYNGHFYLSRLLGKMLNEALDDSRFADTIDAAEWVLVPVPLHSRRLREREFNQAEELCRELARQRGLKMVNALRRTRYTHHQAMLERKERLLNLRGAFTISPKTRERNSIVEKRVLLVDDVLTTGATASECAQTLSDAGALKVVVITVVRG